MLVTTIISAFPGTGKTYFHDNSGYKTLDSDSSSFSWINGQRNPDFPNNYIQHIKDNIGKYQIILVSSHKIVRDALVNAGIKFWLVYPDKACKEEYINRYKSRGSSQQFIDLISDNWENFINEMENQDGCHLLPLKSGLFINDMVWELIIDTRSECNCPNKRTTE